MARVRLDVLLVQRGLAETRERAQSRILAGDILIDAQPATRPSQLIAPDAALAVRPGEPDFVSRGALKLKAALAHWHIDPRDWIVLDVGASTGGFTDLLLRRGARRVYAVDVGYGQLHYRLRNDPRVVLMERTNARNLQALPEQPQLAVVDVSFISLRLVLPPIFRVIEPQASIVTLIKPQFEAGRAEVGKGGVVRDPAVHHAVVQNLKAWSNEQPWHMLEVIESPIRGPAGNREFLGVWHPAYS